MFRFDGVKGDELFGFDPHTTNQRIELMGPIQGLLTLKEPCEVEITTDSEYVFLGMTELLSDRWKLMYSRRKQAPMPNADLWMELDELASLYKPTWVWTRSQAGHEDNVRCDLLARNAAVTQRSSWADGRPHAPLCQLFLSEASKRGYTIEDIVALLNEPGMTVKAAVEQILSTRLPKPN